MENILFGSKYLNINNKYLILIYEFLLWNNNLIKNEEGDNNEGYKIYTLDQN